MTHLIAIASGKGGVGKTWLAITLAHALTRHGQRILLVDADFGLANIDIQLGLMPERDLSTALAGLCPLAAAILHHDAGFDILPGRSGTPSLAAMAPETVDWLLRELHALAPRYDTILLDLGSGLAPALRRLAAAADSLALIVTEEPTSLTDAYAVLKLHAQDCPHPKPTHIIVNQATTPTAGQRIFATLAKACTQYLHTTPTHLGTIRRDDRVRDTIRRQTPLLTRHPTTPAATDAEAIALRLHSIEAIA